MYFDTTCMSMSILHLLLYDQNAFKMQRVSDLAFGRLICNMDPLADIQFILQL